MKQIKDVKKLLLIIDRANNFDVKVKLQHQQELKDQQNLRQQLKKNGKSEKEIDTLNNYSTGKCRLQGHDHESSECQNNPRSKKYNVTHYAIIPEKERIKYNKSNTNKTGGKLNMLHDTVPCVKFQDPGNFTFDSDDESAQSSVGNCKRKGEPM